MTIRKTLFLAIILFIIVGGVFGFISKNNARDDNSHNAGDLISIKLFYYNPANDQGPGGVQCSKNGLIAVVRQIKKTITPIQDTIRELIAGKLTDDEREFGISTEYPLQGLKLKSASMDNGMLTLVFEDRLNKTVGGSCRVNILRAQINETAKQFPGVNEVRILPEDLFQP